MIIFDCLCIWQIMTRWARGSSANRKKPLEATEWTEMSGAGHLDTDSDSAAHKKRTDKLHSRRRMRNDEQQNQERLDNSQQNVADELEKLGRKSRLVASSSESVMLEEFVRKDARREARRLKRQQQKQLSRVC